MLDPAHDRDGHRLILIQRADIRATARTVRSLGVTLTALGLGAWWFDDYEAVGLGAFGLVGALVGGLMVLVGIAVLAINRRQVILDDRTRTITGLPTDVAFDAIAAVMLTERGHTVEHQRRRRVVLNVVPRDALTAAQRHALDAGDSASLALDLPTGLALIDHDSELSLLRTARLVAEALSCPIIDAASAPVSLITRGEHGPSLRAQRLADGPRPSAPGPAPEGLTVHSEVPLHVSWPGIRYQGALWAFLGLMLGIFGVGYGLGVRGGEDVWAWVSVGVPVLIFSYGMITRRGRTVLKVDPTTVQFTLAGLHTQTVRSETVLGLASVTEPRIRHGLTLPEQPCWTIFPEDAAQAEWIGRAVEYALTAPD